MIDAAPHHVGCAVERMEDGIAIYGGVFGLARRTRPIAVESQHVQVCFLQLSNTFYLELVAPLNEQAKLGPFLKSGFYHLCFLVDELAEARKELRALRYLAFAPFRSEAFAGNLCQFFLTPQNHLIELAEIPAPGFDDFFRANLAEALERTGPAQGGS